MRQYISGSTPGLTKAALIAREAGVSLEWLATGKGRRPTPGNTDALSGKQMKAEHNVRLFEQWREMLQDVPLELLTTGGETHRSPEEEDALSGERMTTGHGVPLFEHWREMLRWLREGELPDAAQPVEAKPKLGPRAFALPVRSRIMAPLFPAGSRIIVDPSQPKQTDSYVVVQVEGWDEATFRRLVIDAGHTYLEPFNTDYRTIDISDKQYTYCGRVVWMELNLLNPPPI